MNLQQILASSPYDLYFLVVDSSLDLTLDLSNFFPIRSSQFSDNHSENPNPSQDKNITNSAILLSLPDTLNYITANSRSRSRRPAIVAFKPSAKVNLLCQKHNFLYLANPAPLSRRLENKIHFAQLCQHYRLPTPPCRLIKLSPSTFRQAQSEFGSSLIIQTGFGWAGNSTFLFDSWDQASQKIPLKSLVKVSPRLTGYTLTNNCCLTKSGLIQSPPAVQFTGITGLTDNPFATVGRQWPAFTATDILAQVTDITNKFGQILSSLNYRGYFGLDFFVSRNQVYLLECNPRLTASFAFYHHLEQSAGYTPLFLLHLSEFLDIHYPVNPKKENRRSLDQHIQGYQLARRNSQGKIISLISGHKPLVSDPSSISIPKDIFRRLS